MQRLLFLPLVALPLVLSNCIISEGCTEIGCESTVTVDYGSIVVNEPYTLTINPDGQTVSVICLSDNPDDEPLPEWLSCDAGGFEITGELADGLTTISVAVVPLSTGEAAIPNTLVTLTLEELLQPNGPVCGPLCDVSVGSVKLP